MSKRILVVEDDFDISNMLRIYFSGQGYEVEVAPKGEEALQIVNKKIPNLIVLDINLPDMNGYDVCIKLRNTKRTSHVPIIFLTQKDERSDKIRGLELGADDYITKPFDIEELKLRVVNSIQAAERVGNLDPKSNLPTGRLIEDHLRELMRSSNDWSYVDVKINNYEQFSDVYGWTAGDEVLRFAAILIGEVVDQLGTSSDFLGHPGRDNFVIITHTANVTSLIDKLVDEFEERVKQHYSFIDRERGYMLVPDGENGEKQVDLMSFAIGSVSTRTHQFSDIREITELAAEDRRGHASSDSASDLLTSW